MNEYPHLLQKCIEFVLSGLGHQIIFNHRDHLEEENLFSVI